MKKILACIPMVLFYTSQVFSQGIIINHTCTKIAQIPESAILNAKQNLHIAYGHTSHGSQLIDGMNGLVAFMNGNGYTNNLYEWNNGGTGGALDLHDYAMGGDVGYYPDWVNNTRDYLGEPDSVTGRGTGAHADVNVVIWSWCGQVSDKYANGVLQSEYLDPMAQLETDYFGVKFVYMTGHLDHGQDANNKAANQVIRDFCVTNNKILYDFSDIESYDPDDVYYQYANDDCSYYSASDGDSLGNWAIEWQNSHTVDVDWYNCGSAHSEPLNANRKAYAAWWLWARIANWDGTTGIANEENEPSIVSVFPNPSKGKFTVSAINNNIQTIEIYNLMGTKVFSMLDVQHVANKEITISDYEKGIYFIKVFNGKKIHSEKIIIQ